MSENLNIYNYALGGILELALRRTIHIDLKSLVNVSREWRPDMSEAQIISRCTLYTSVVQTVIEFKRGNMKKSVNHYIFNKVQDLQRCFFVLTWVNQ